MKKEWFFSLLLLCQIQVEEALYLIGNSFETLATREYQNSEPLIAQG